MLGNPAIFYLSSANRASGTSTEFTIELKDFPAINRFDRISLAAASVPKTYYLVDSRHQTLTLDENGTQSTITIPEGNYAFDKTSTSVLGPPSMRSDLETLLNASGSWTYSITANQRTGKYEFAVSGNGGVQPDIIIPTDRLAKILGLDTGTNSFSSDALTSPYVVNFQHTTSILIASNLVGDPSGVLQDIHSTSEDFSNLVYRSEDMISKSKPLATNRSQVASFTIMDFEDQEILDLQGHDVSLVLTIFRHDDTNLFLAKAKIDSMIKKAIDMSLK